MKNINVAHIRTLDDQTHQITLLMSADCYQQDVILAMNHLAATIGPNHYRRSDVSDDMLPCPLIQEFGWKITETSRGAAFGLIQRLQGTDVISTTALGERSRWDAALKEAMTHLYL